MKQHSATHLIALLALLASAATASAAPGAKTIFEADTVRVLRNPLQGWVMYLGRNWDENFWTERGYDNMHVAGDTATVRVSDYASCAYIRTSWASFEPEEGKYIWNDPNSRLMKLLRSVRQRGLRIAFRIVVDGRDQAQNTPQYVFDAGAQGYYDPKNPGKNLSPYPDDPVFQEKYSRFLHEFARRFDNPDEVEFIDAYSLGKWGESHSMIYKDNSNKENVFNWITTLATNCFKRVPMLIHYHRMLGDPDDDGWGSVPADAEKLLSKAVNSGFSLRHDAFGMTGYYQDWEKRMARKLNFKRPIVMEGGWITGAHHRYWRDPSGCYREAHPEDVRLGEFEAAKEARVNMMDFRINDETRSWFEDSFPLVKSFVAHGGYRLHPVSASAPTNARAGRDITIETEWENLGWGYCPVNIPQWNQKYKVAVALLGADGTSVRISVEKKSDLAKWVNGKKAKHRTKISLQGLAPGLYTAAIAIVDTTDSDRPALELAVDKELIAPNGWLRCSEMEIRKQ